MARKWKTMTDDEREREYNQRLERGLPFIKSDLPQYRPRDGENFIRILPPIADDKITDAWGANLICHYIEGQGWVLSPKTLDQTNHDPIDDLIRELRKIDPDLEDMVQTSRKVGMHILDFNADEKYGVLKLWAAPTTLVDDFVKAAKDKRTGRTYSLDDPENGFPLSFDKSGTGLQTRYGGVQLDRDPFPLDEELLDDVEYWEDILVVYSDAEFEKIIESILAGAESGGGRRHGRGRRGRDDEEETRPRSRGRGRRGRDEDDEDDREPPPTRGARGRGRDRDDDEDEDEPPARGRGRGRGRARDKDDDEVDEVDEVRSRVRDKIGKGKGNGEDETRGSSRRGISRRKADDDENEEEEAEAPPRRSSRGKGGGSSRRSSRK